MFRVGQKIVCIDADGANMLSVDSVYTIAAIDPCAPRRWRGKVFETSSLHLWETKPEPMFVGFHPRRFRPAVDRPTDIAIFKKMLRPKDVPLPAPRVKREGKRVSEDV